MFTTYLGWNVVSTKSPFICFRVIMLNVFTVTTWLVVANRHGLDRPHRVPDERHPWKLSVDCICLHLTVSLPLRET